MKAFLLTFSLLATLIAFGQTAPDIQWQRTYGGSKDDMAAAIKVTTDSGYIIAGKSQSNDGDMTGNYGDYDGWIAKLDNTGAIQWQINLGGSGEDAVTAIAQTFDKGYIAVVYSESEHGNLPGNFPLYKISVIKISANGNFEWGKKIDSVSFSYINSIQQTKDSGYILAGHIELSNVPYPANPNNGWVVKLSSTGNIEWQAQPGGNDLDNLNKIIQTRDGGYLAVGQTSSTDIAGLHFLDRADNYEDMYVVKFNAKGIIQWQKCYGSYDNEGAYDIAPTLDNGYILSGMANSNGGDVSGFHANTDNHNYGDAWLVKIDSIGNLQWQKCLGGSYLDVGLGIKPAPDSSGYFMMGITKSNDGDVSGLHGAVNNASDEWVVKTDNFGNLLWQKCLGGTGNETSNFSINLTPDGNLVTIINTNSTDGDVTGLHGNKYDFWVVKLSPESVLPVALTTFTAQKQHNDVLLQWQTATEINSKQFNIQRSNDGSRFTTIGVTPAAGNSTSLARYSYVDVAALVQPGTLYYRLEQVDKDGSKYYSKVAVIKNLPADVFTVMPNPVKSTIMVQSKINAARATVQLSDMNGKVIYSSNKTISAGYLQIPAANLAAGTYNLTIQANGDKYVVKVVKE